MISELEKIQKRATKSVINLKKIPYNDRLMHFKLPTLKYRRLRGDMIEVFKITHNIYDPEVSLELRYYPKSNTRLAQGETDLTIFRGAVVKRRRQ